MKDFAHYNPVYILRSFLCMRVRLLIYLFQKWSSVTLIQSSFLKVIYLPEKWSLPFPAAACYKEITRSDNSCRSTTGSSVSGKSCALCCCSGCRLSGVDSTSGKILALRRSKPVPAATAVAAAVVVAMKTTAISADTPLSKSRVDTATHSRTDVVGRMHVAFVARRAIAGSDDGFAVAVAAETSRGSICRAPHRSRRGTAIAFPRQSRQCIGDDGRIF